MGSMCVCAQWTNVVQGAVQHELGLKLFLPPKHVRGALAPLSTL